ncbi:unnamed protein product [Brachionus calyciflorus]|uniref:Glycoside hydrolase family 19 catalytic domain-containing protein n=1 Tax=Brachionus calyciflorus TaxID=104777 RepID=A0A814H2K5_9BILA|nr:unnamed protein product [Brachionus calyciflorus]
MLSPKLRKFAFILLIISAVNLKIANAIYCYTCNSNWQACGENPDLNMLKYNKEPCSGPCKIWKDSTTIYRSCTYDPEERISGVKYCNTDLCNHNIATISEIQSVQTTTAKATTQTPTNPVTTKPVTTKPATTATTTSRPANKTILCYECNANLKACNDPVDLGQIQNLQVECSGACVSYKNPADNNKIYRGCLDKIKNGGQGTYYGVGGIVYKYCSTDLCNFIPISPITTKAPLPTTTKPTVQTTQSTKPIIVTATTTKPNIVTAPPSGNNLITFDEFTRAVTKAGYPAPSMEKYNNFVNQLGPKGGITTKREAAMFLSQILWESDGLVAKAEYACVQTGCPGVYGTSQYPGQSYYGRGYIQLSWNYNYDACSRALYGDDRLLRDPNQVATNDEIAWATAFWFWKTNVGSNPNVKNGNFGSSTMAINGGLECNGPYQDKARKRFDIYKIVMLEFGLTETPNERGCYN